MIVLRHPREGFTMQVDVYATKHQRRRITFDECVNWIDLVVCWYEAVRRTRKGKSRFMTGVR